MSRCLDQFHKELSGRTQSSVTECDVEAIAAKVGESARSCIFISHFHIDKNIVRAISKYIMEHGGLDVYSMRVLVDSLCDRFRKKLK